MKNIPLICERQQCKFPIVLAQDRHQYRVPLKNLYVVAEEQDEVDKSGESITTDSVQRHYPNG